MVNPQVPAELPAPVIDSNPPESLRVILEKRVAPSQSPSRTAPMLMPVPAPKTKRTSNYRRAILNGAIAGVLCMLLAGTVFLIQSLR